MTSSLAMECKVPYCTEGTEGTEEKRYLSAIDVAPAKRQEFLKMIMKRLSDPTSSPTLVEYWGSVMSQIISAPTSDWKAELESPKILELVMSSPKIMGVIQNVPNGMSWMNSVWDNSRLPIYLDNFVLNKMFEFNSGQIKVQARDMSMGADDVTKSLATLSLGIEDIAKVTPASTVVAATERDDRRVVIPCLDLCRDPLSRWLLIRHQCYQLGRYLNGDEVRLRGELKFDDPIISDVASATSVTAGKGATIGDMIKAFNFGYNSQVYCSIFDAPHAPRSVDGSSYEWIKQPYDQLCEFLQAVIEFPSADYKRGAELIDKIFKYSEPANVKFIMLDEGYCQLREVLKPFGFQRSLLHDIKTVTMSDFRKLFLNHLIYKLEEPALIASDVAAGKMKYKECLTNLLKDNCPPPAVDATCMEIVRKVRKIYSTYWEPILKSKSIRDTLFKVLSTLHYLAPFQNMKVDNELNYLIWQCDGLPLHISADLLEIFKIGRREVSPATKFEGDPDEWMSMLAAQAQLLGIYWRDIGATIRDDVDREKLLVEGYWSNAKIDDLVKAFQDGFNKCIVY